MKMGKIKQRFFGVFLAIVSILFLCGPAGAEFEVNNPPVGMAGAPVLGVRITGFSNNDTSSNNLIVGIPPLSGPPGVLWNVANTPEEWIYDGNGCNRLRLTTSADDLTLQIGHGPDCEQIGQWHTVSMSDIYQLLDASGKEAFDRGLNILQLNIASLACGSGIEVKGLQWAGVSFPDFYSYSVTNQFSITGNLGTSIFVGPYGSASFEADIVLQGSSFSDSYVEFLFGRFIPPNQPPDCVNGVNYNPFTLWPANGDMWEVGVSVTDPDGDPVTVQATGIRQDEPVCDSAGPCQADGTIIDGMAKLRAKRNPVGNGRVYTVTFTATDNKGGSCFGEVKVPVPKNRGKNGIALDDGPVFDSLSAVP